MPIDPVVLATKLFELEAKLTELATEAHMNVELEVANAYHHAYLLVSELNREITAITGAEPNVQF